MEQYIPKSALVAEIEKRRNKHFNSGGSPSSEYCHEDNEILGIIDTLEVKDVDLENIAAIEWDNYIRQIDGDPNNAYMLIERNQYINLAKHFFELGLK